MVWFTVNISSEERKELERRGFSSSKKLDQIKKKYKFEPKRKGKKDDLKERNTKYRYSPFISNYKKNFLSKKK